jgi:hypothetical protein
MFAWGEERTAFYSTLLPEKKVEGIIEDKHNDCA